MTLKYRGGKLLFRDGHLCTTCCNQCSGPNCVNLAAMMPRIGYESCPVNDPLSLRSCDNGADEYPVIRYRSTLANPLSVTADLVISKAGLADDDLRVDGVLLSGDPCQINLPLPLGMVIASGVAGSGSIILEVVDNMWIDCGIDDACACWVPTIPSVSMSSAQMRYAACRACAESLDDGFSCRLVTGCCFGRKRADLSVRCPLSKW